MGGRWLREGRVAKLETQGCCTLRNTPYRIRPKLRPAAFAGHIPPAGAAILIHDVKHQPPSPQATGF